MFLTILLFQDNGLCNSRLVTILATLNFRSRNCSFSVTLMPTPGTSEEDCLRSGKSLMELPFQANPLVDSPTEESSPTISVCACVLFQFLDASPFTFYLMVLNWFSLLALKLFITRLIQLFFLPFACLLHNRVPSVFCTYLSISLFHLELFVPRQYGVVSLLFYVGQHALATFLFVDVIINYCFRQTL